MPGTKPRHLRARQGYEGWKQATPTHSHVWLDCTVFTPDPPPGIPVICQVCGEEALLPFQLIDEHSYGAGV